MVEDRDLNHFFLKQILDNIGDGLIHTDEKGIICYMNFSAQEILRVDNVLGRNIREIFLISDAKNLAQDQETIDCVLKEGVTKGLKKHSAYILKTGEIVYLSATLAPILENDVVCGMVISFRDISKLVTAEKELIKLSSAIEQNPTSIVLTDIEGNIEYVNPVFTEITGYTFEEVKGKNPHIFKTNFRDDTFYRKLWETILAGQVWKGEFLNKKKSGELFWEDAWIAPIKDEDGEISNFVGIKEDVTEKKRISKILENNEKRLRLITDNMRDAIIQTDEEGIIEYASPSTKGLFGYDVDELITRHIDDFIHLEEKTKIALLKKEKLEINDTTEVRVIKKDGRYIWVEATVNEIKDQEITGRVFICRDITIKKRADEQMKKAIAVAENANRAKSQFLANMSHEIRTPMNGILGMTTLTLMTELTEEQKENLEMVKNSADSLLRIINSILDFSKIEAGKLILENYEFNLRGLVQSTLATFKYKAEEKGIDLRLNFNLSSERHYIGDAGRIQQILTNLIGNAIKFTEQGYVQIVVDTLIEEKGHELVQFSIIDTGIGIPKEKINHLFESFSQVDGSITRKFGGTGLGLAISKQLIELMQGQIVVESIEGKGSSFIFNIELKVSDTKQLYSVSDQFSIPNADKKLSILLVEDDKINQMVTVSLIEKQGHTIDLANNGVEAVQKVKDKSYDLILMDIQMPEMDGIEATHHIRTYEFNRNQHTPIIAVTAYAVQGDRERFLEAGMDDYISKPLDIAKFYDIIRKHTGYDQGEKEKETARLDEIKHIIENTNKTKDLSPSEMAEFIEAIEQQIAQMREFVAKGALNKVEPLAKTIKALTTEKGCPEVGRLAFKIQMEARKGEVSRLNQLINDIEKIILRL